MKVKAQTYQHQTKQEWDINKEDMDIFEQIFFTEVRLGIAHHMKKKIKETKLGGIYIKQSNKKKLILAFMI